MAIKKKTRQLSSLSNSELLEYVRKLRTQLKELREVNKTLADASVDLAEEMAELRDQAEEMADLRDQLAKATDNNSRLQGIIESAGQDVQIQVVDNRVITRLDTIIDLMKSGMVHSSGEDEDYEEDDSSIDDEPPFGRDDNEDLPPFVDDLSDEDEDDASDEDSNVPENTNTVRLDVLDVQELLGLIIPAITKNIEVLGETDFENTFRAPVRRGDISKDFALRQYISTIYPEAPHMGDTILENETLRNAVYAAMGL